MSHHREQVHNCVSLPISCSRACVCVCVRWWRNCSDVCLYEGELPVIQLQGRHSRWEALQDFLSLGSTGNTRTLYMFLYLYKDLLLLTPNRCRCCFLKLTHTESWCQTVLSVRFPPNKSGEGQEAPGYCHCELCLSSFSLQAHFKPIKVLHLWDINS